jgi:hypothetical protein
MPNLPVGTSTLRSRSTYFFCSRRCSFFLRERERSRRCSFFEREREREKQKVFFTGCFERTIGSIDVLSVGVSYVTFSLSLN